MQKVKEKYATKNMLSTETDKTHQLLDKEFLRIKDFKKSFKKIEETLSEHNITQAKISKVAKEQKETMKSLKEAMKDKAEKKSLEHIKEQMRSFTTYKDLKDLYNKVVP